MNKRPNRNPESGRGKKNDRGRDSEGKRPKESRPYKKFNRDDDGGERREYKRRDENKRDQRSRGPRRDDDNRRRNYSRDNDDQRDDRRRGSRDNRDDRRGNRRDDDRRRDFRRDDRGRDNRRRDDDRSRDDRRRDDRRGDDQNDRDDRRNSRYEGRPNRTRNHHNKPFRRDDRDRDREDRPNPRLKRTNKYKDSDARHLGDWRNDLPEDRKIERESGLPKKRPGETIQITEEVRLNKFLANAGICSRRDADDHIANGMVTVNDEVVTELGSKVQPGDDVRFKGRQVLPEKPVYIILNKPKNTITSDDDPEGRRTVIDFIKNDVLERVYPVGRLDRNTTGVILLTNDGDLSQKLTHPSNGVHKVYKATLDKALTKKDMEQLAAGIELEDGPILADAIAYADESKKVIGIEIHSGKNHIVHRMFNHFGYKVEKLDRVSFAGLTKERLDKGEFRHLTQKELNLLRKQSGKMKD